MASICCPVCGEKIGLFNREKSADGIICSACHSFFFANLNVRASKTPTATLQVLWQEIANRQAIFHETDSIYDADSLFISIDEPNRLFRFGHRNGDRGRRMIYRFDEVKAYISDAERKTISVRKQDIIGSHIETSVKHGEKELVSIRFELPSCTVDISSQTYPAGFTKFLSHCISSRQKNTLPKSTTSKNHSAADELLKYKKLLDLGAITQEEYNIKKTQLLEL